MKRSRQARWLGAVALALRLVMPIANGYAEEMPCTVEIQAYCAEVQPGGGRLLQCLEKNQTKLSMACAQRVTELREAASGPLAACREDWVALCYHPRAATGRQAMIQCLRAYQAQVSPGCQKVLQGVSGKQRQQPQGMMP